MEHSPRMAHNESEIVEITRGLLSDRNEVKLEINDRKITGKSPNIWRLNNTLLNNTWVKVVSRETFKYFELMKKIQLSKFMGYSKSSG